MRCSRYFVLLLFFCCKIFYAQQRAFLLQQLGSEDGLNSSTIFSIKQSHNRAMYMATENGIYSYDGYIFTKLSFPEGSLNYNSIRTVLFSSENELVIATRYDGCYTYDLIHKQLKKSSLKFENPTDELIYENDVVYSLTDKVSIEGYHIKTKKTSIDSIKLYAPQNAALCIYQSHNTKKVYVGRQDGIYELIKGRQRKLNTASNFEAHSITEDSHGQLFIGSKNCILRVNSNGTFSSIQIKQNNTLDGLPTLINKLQVDKYEKLWFTTWPNDNLYLYDKGATYNVFDLLNIDKTVINCIEKDKDDNIWLGTFNDGVYFIQNSFINNVSFRKDDNLLSVTAAQVFGDNAIIGTNNGLFNYTFSQNKLEDIVASDKLFPEAIYQLQKTNATTLLYGKRSSFLNSEKNIRYSNQILNLKPLNGKTIYPLTNTTFLFSDWSANILRQTNDDKIDTIVSFDDYRIKINVLAEKDSQLFIGTSNGLIITNAFKYTYLKKYDYKLNSTVNDLLLHNSILYIAHEKGISTYTQQKGIASINTPLSSSIKKIKFYKDKFWLATSEGLQIYDAQFSLIGSYKKANGLASNIVNDIIFNDTICCICTNKGISICTINDLLSNIKAPVSVTINKIEVNNIETYFNNDTLSLGTDDIDLKLHISSPLYTKPNNQYYRYRFDKAEWIDLNNIQLHFPFIENGQHTIEIICSYDNIHWSDPLKLTVIKATPFWNTVLFYIIVVILILFIIFFITWLIIKRIKLKAALKLKEEQQINFLKHQAMNSLLSPHFIFNSLTSIQNYINTNNGLKASEYLGKFSRLIRMIIEKASQGEIILHEEITRLSYYLELEKERFKNKFDYKIIVDETIDTTIIKIPNMIIQPHVENAIIHGILPKNEHGIIEINFKLKQPQLLEITIEDNGIGYEKAKEHAKKNHKSLGTSTIKHILELNTKLTGKKQSVGILDKHQLNENTTGTIITITLEI